MKRILFSHSYFLRFDPKQWRTGLPYAPLGTLYAAALMRDNDYEVAVFDSMFSTNPDDVQSYLEEQNPDFFVVYDDEFNYLTKMCLTNMREAAFTMMEKAKAKDCTVIVASSDATDHFEKYIHAGADFVLIGEAEITLLELVNAITNDERDFSSIPGLAYAKNNAIIKTAKRSVLKDLDIIPFPAWDLIDMEPYRRSWITNAGYFSINMTTTRGCPFKCNWCAKPIYGNRYNSRSPKNVVTEIKILIEQYHFDHIWFCDDIFGLKPGWVKEFAELLEKEQIQIQFKIQSRADLLVQENYVHDLALAGCKNVWMGAESGSQKILDAMDKGTTIPQIYKATRLLKEYEIKPSFFIQFGYPGETKEDIAMTIGMINELLPDDIGISVSYPLPGTVFYDRVKAELKNKANWTDSDELHLMFKNSYPPEFYKQLHRYVHKSYRKHLALKYMKQLLRLTAPINGKHFKKAISIIYYLPAAFISRQKLNLIAVRAS